MADSSVVAWRVDAGTVLSLNDRFGGLPKEDLLNIARSVRPDPDTVRFPMSFGWLPPGLATGWAQFYGDSPTVWSAAFSAQGAGEILNPSGPPAAGGGHVAVSSYVAVTLGPTVDNATVPAGGRSLTVRGHPARLVTMEMPSEPGYTLINRYLIVELAPGEILTVFTSALTSHPLSEADLQKIAERLNVDPDPDTMWIGAR